MPEIDSAVVLAGGLAKRMMPMTASTPKSMLVVAGRPFIEHQIELLRRQGIKRLVLCLAHLGTIIEGHIGDGSRFGLEVRYSYDGPTRMGTAGALRQAQSLLPDVFFLTYGDSFLPCDWRSVAREFFRYGKRALMALCRNAGQWDTSNVWFEQGEIRAYDKKHLLPAMQHIDYGLAVITRDVIRDVSEGCAVDLVDVYSRLLAQGELAACEVTDRFYEIGSPQGLTDLESYFNRR